MSNIIHRSKYDGDFFSSILGNLIKLLHIHTLLSEEQYLN